MRCNWYFRVYNYYGFSEIISAYAQSAIEAEQIIRTESEYPIEKMEFLYGEAYKVHKH